MAAGGPDGGVSQVRFRAVMGRFGAGVTVMTSVDGDVPHGMTANAVASVSLEPPLVLVCVERGTVMLDLVRSSGRFALSFLPADRRDLSEHFAAHDRPPGRAMFEGVRLRTAATGVPILAHTVGWVDCTVWADHDGGDHAIIVGRVEALGEGEDAAALAYYRSRYVRLELPPDAS